MMLSTKRERYITIMAAIALVFNLVLNLILIPRYQQVAAAVVTSLTELLLVGLAIFFTPRPLFPTGSILVGAKALVASLVMALIIWIIRGYGLFIILPAAMVIYFTTATLLGTIPREDMKALYTSIRNKRKYTAPDALPDESKAEPQVVETSYLSDIDTRPEIAASFTWRSEWTNPDMATFGHELRSLSRYNANMDLDTVPLDALHRDAIVDVDTVSLGTLRRDPIYHAKCTGPDLSPTQSASKPQQRDAIMDVDTIPLGTLHRDPIYHVPRTNPKVPSAQLNGAMQQHDADIDEETVLICVLPKPASPKEPRVSSEHLLREEQSSGENEVIT
jgi:hypothetical protein